MLKEKITIFSQSHDLLDRDVYSQKLHRNINYIMSWVSTAKIVKNSVYKMSLDLAGSTLRGNCPPTVAEREHMSVAHKRL